MTLFEIAFLASLTPWLAVGIIDIKRRIELTYLKERLREKKHED
jgi:hypothetical protein